jgi:hypothetical protein
MGRRRLQRCLGEGSCSPGHPGMYAGTGGMRTDWASEARRDVDGMLPDYDQSVGKMLRLLEAYGGHEVSDPAKIATLIVQLSRRDDLPLRLLLGGMRCMCVILRTMSALRNSSGGER